MADDAVVERVEDGWIWSALVLKGFMERFKGRRGWPATWPTAVFPRCRSIHSLGMDHALDVAFVDGEGEVLKVVRSLGPNRIRTCPHASWVMERLAAGDCWVKQGDKVRILGMEEKDGGATEGVPRGGTAR